MNVLVKSTVQHLYLLTFSIMRLIDSLNVFIYLERVMQTNFLNRNEDKGNTKYHVSH